MHDDVLFAKGGVDIHHHCSVETGIYRKWPSSMEA